MTKAMLVITCDRVKSCPVDLISHHWRSGLVLEKSSDFIPALLKIYRAFQKYSCIPFTIFPYEMCPKSASCSVCCKEKCLVPPPEAYLLNCLDITKWAF
jgi:hypothetical protein